MHGRGSALLSLVKVLALAGFSAMILQAVELGAAHIGWGEILTGVLFILQIRTLSVEREVAGKIGELSAARASTLQAVADVKGEVMASEIRTGNRVAHLEHRVDGQIAARSA